MFTIIIEDILKDLRIYGIVVSNLQRKYDCYLQDCYDDPIFLYLTLTELFKNSHQEMIKSIKQNLLDRMEVEMANEFLLKSKNIDDNVFLTNFLHCKIKTN